MTYETYNVLKETGGLSNVVRLPSKGIRVLHRQYGFYR